MIKLTITSSYIHLTKRVFSKPANWILNNEKILFYNKRGCYTFLYLNLLEVFIFFLDKKETKTQANIHFLTQKLLKNPKLKKLHFIVTIYLV